MMPVKILPFFLTTSVLMAAFLAGPSSIAAQNGCMAAQCHADQGAARHAHGPVSAGDCTACHTPHESDIKSHLVKQGDELCFECHIDIKGLLTKKTVHPALEGGCTSCHNPHGTDHPKLLSEEGEQLCFQCHDSIKETIAKATVGHPAITSEKGCASCHSPHASDNPKLLVKQEKETCLACHATIITAAMTVLHGPIKDGSCTVCHEPHGSQHPNLLAGKFPADEYAAYSDTEYELCFSCHNRDLVKYPDTSFATGFRDGERNLHYLHVNKQKGRSCKLCHEIHGGTQARLVADSVAFGTWKLPLKFVKTETGGGCSPGCHKMSSYDRQTPGKKPDPSPPSSKGN